MFRILPAPTIPFLILISLAQTVFISTARSAEMKSMVSKKSYHLVKEQPVAVSTYSAEASLIFDFPVEYNSAVRGWLKHFQTNGRYWFTKWMERSQRVIPRIQNILIEEGLPKDLVYKAMIESGFSTSAESHASAVGPWQFIKPTATRYGLKVNWWIDERRDIDKSTRAAARYIKDLYKMFGSWYLVAAAYNTGENRVKRMIKKHGTRDYWTLAKKKALHPETTNYVPKMIAAMLIAKAPGLYGFRKIKYQEKMQYERFIIPGGTRLSEISKHLNIRPSILKRLNPELLVDQIPRSISFHEIRIPFGTTYNLSQFIRRQVALNE